MYIHSSHPTDSVHPPHDALVNPFPNLHTFGREQTSTIVREHKITLIHTPTLHAFGGEHTSRAAGGIQCR